jgi:hypothetical protein
MSAAVCGMMPHFAWLWARLDSKSNILDKSADSSENSLWLEK